MRLSIYLAGPDVFAPNCAKRLEKKRKYLEKKLVDVEVLTPFDINPPKLKSKKEVAYAIRENNLHMVQKCDIVLANLNPFRGDEPDSGTVYEVAYATAYEKLVVGYLDEAKTTQRKRLGKKDDNGWEVEDFDLPLNLMLHGDKFIITDSFEKAVKKIKKLYM